MNKIIRYTYGAITVKDFLQVEEQIRSQKTTDDIYITEVEYNPISQIMKVVQIEKDLSNLPNRV